MISSACNLMKKAILIAAFLFIIGFIMQFVTHMLSMESSFIVMANFLSIFSIFAACFIILVTVITVLLPSVRRKLDTCQH